MKADEKKRKKMTYGSTGSGSYSGVRPPPPCTTWCTPHLGVSCTDRNRSRIGAIIHNSNHDNSSRLPSSHHSSFPPVTFPATTAERWGTLLESAANLSKATHCELQHPWSINRGANRRVLCHGLSMPTIPPQRKLSSKKKC
jgi:hypothetical protein